MEKCRILSIDAWNSPDGWYWNNWFDSGELCIAINISNRELLRQMRVHGYLTDDSKGKVGVEDDGYNLVIYARSNMEPLFAIEYGVHC